MKIELSFEQEFNDLMNRLKRKYPKELLDLEGIGKQLDLKQFTESFFSSEATADVSIDPNANVEDRTVIAYNSEAPKPLFKLYSYYNLWKGTKELTGSEETARIVVENQFLGDIYIHDMTGIGTGQPYCFNYSTMDIVNKGLPMIKKIKSVPPKHLYAFKSQLEQFTVVASNSTLGATGLADLLVVMSYFVNNILKTKSDAHFKFASEQDCWRYVRENIVSFIYTINQPMRANQSPFTNVSIYDEYFLEEVCGNYIFPDYSKPKKNIVKRLQEIYVDIMNEEMKRTPITFPVTTACFSVDENSNIQDEEFLEFVSEKNKDFGFINIYCGDSSTLSSCCRLRSERKSEYFNSFGSGSTKIGSLGVVTINLPRLAVRAIRQTEVDPKDFFLTKVKEFTELAGLINQVKRNVVKGKIDGGSLPLYNLEFMDLSKQYSTVGINGLNEAIEILGYDILDTGQLVVLEMLEVVNRTNDELQKLYDAPHNCEQVPGENMSIKSATKDRLLGYQDEYDIYSNQFIPLTTNADLLDRITLQGLFDKHFSGGAICHINVDERIEDTEQLKDLTRECAKQGVVYFAINYNLQECENGHMSVGRAEVCHVCAGEIVGNYTRVVGFLTNTKNWHKKRREMDYPNRQFYSGI